LILDEPTSALDAKAQRQMAGELNALKEKTSLIIITHSPDMFPAPDQIVDFEERQ
jgi:ABC-type bacteriocin/lantibiotic exporter with double-glycine peptidase domain